MSQTRILIFLFLFVAVAAWAFPYDPNEILGYFFSGIQSLGRNVVAAADVVGYGPGLFVYRENRTWLQYWKGFFAVTGGSAFLILTLLALL
jgi:hypothetical protein